MDKLSIEEKAKLFDLINNTDADLKIDKNSDAKLSVDHNRFNLSNSQKAVLFGLQQKGFSVSLTSKKDRPDTCGCGLSIDDCCNYNDRGCPKSHLSYNKQKRARELNDY